jgi:hypothetical protein
VTEIQIQGRQFLIDGAPTYRGVTHRGEAVEGLLLNSRMVQAIFDDENPATAHHWRYPDTGVWDPDRNTDEFCAALPEYRRHGLLAVTVGLQGGGSMYQPEVFDHYVNSAFDRRGALKAAYAGRLRRVLDAADAAGMVVIVNYLYWRQIDKLEGDAAVRRAVEEATDWLLRTGHRNVLVDVVNEFHPGQGLLRAGGIHELIEIVQQTTVDGRRLLASASVHPEKLLPDGRWQTVQDFYLPHGNDLWADELRQALRQIQDSPPFSANPRPILINEDSIHLDSLEAAVGEYSSWGYYSQGYGCGGWQHGRFDWLARGREDRYQDLSGFQTVPVNWSINTPAKRAFFDRVAAITGATGQSDRPTV